MAILHPPPPIPPDVMPRLRSFARTSARRRLAVSARRGGMRWRSIHDGPGRRQWSARGCRRSVRPAEQAHAPEPSDAGWVRANCAPGFRRSTRVVRRRRPVSVPHTVSERQFGVRESVGVHAERSGHVARSGRRAESSRCPHRRLPLGSRRPVRSRSQRIVDLLSRGRRAERHSTSQISGRSTLRRTGNGRGRSKSHDRVPKRGAGARPRTGRCGR